MKIKVNGKQHLQGVSKKTGKPYDMTVIHTMFPQRGVEGNAAKQIMLNYSDCPTESVTVGAEYSVEFDNTGYPVSFVPVTPAGK